jgi:hypothetical protein
LHPRVPLLLLYPQPVAAQTRAIIKTVCNHFFASVLLFLTSIFGGHHTVTVHIAPSQWHANGKSASAAVFNAAVASSQPHTKAAAAVSSPKLLADAQTSAAPTPVRVAAPLPAPTAMLAASLSGTNYITQDELTAQLQIATNNLRNLIYSNTSGGSASQVAQGQYASGGYTNEIALSNKIDQLNGTTLNNVVVNGISGITAAEIPTSIVAANYLPLAGGTLTGSVINSGTASSSFAGALGIGTSSPSDTLAVNGPVYLADIAARRWHSGCR